jgi:hypothetical protein
MAVKSSSKFHFQYWVIFFFVSLVLVSVLLTFHQVVIAKILGVVIVLTISILVRVWLKKVSRVKQRPDSIHIGINEQFWLKENSEFFRLASVSDRKTIETRIGLFLTKISIEEEGKPVPTKELCLSIALSAVEFFFSKPFWDLGLFSSISIETLGGNSDYEIEVPSIKISPNFIASSEMNSIWEKIERISLSHWQDGKLSNDIYAEDFFAKS